MSMPILHVLSEGEVDRIHSASLGILNDVGIEIHHDWVLRELEEAGALVDYPKRMVKIPPSLVQESVKKAPKLPTLAGRSRENDVRIEPGKTYTRSASGAIYMIDSQTGKRRDATTVDVENFTKLQDALQNISFCGGSPYPSDTHPALRDIHQMRTMLESTMKHIRFQPLSGRNLDFIVKLASAVAGSEEELEKRPIISCIAAPSSPLRYSTEQIEVMIGCGRHGLPVMLGSTPTVGATGPVTLAGSLALQNAEILAGVVLCQVITPGAPLSYGPRMPTMDMRTGLSSWGAVEFGLAAAASVQIGQLYGIEIDAYGPTSDAKALDEQAAIEKTFNAVLPALAGAHVINGAGVLESILTVSFEQLVIDNEMLGMMFRMLRGIEISQATLADDVIRRVGAGGNFLADVHTLEHFRAEHFIPEVFDRKTRMMWERAGNKDVVSASRELAQRLLREHQAVPLDKNVLREMDLIVVNAKKELVKSPN